MLARTEQVHVLSLSDLHQRLKDEIYERTNGVVQDGPFKGVQLYPDRGWPDSNIAAELLGFFEQELHGDIEKEIARLSNIEHPRIVNVGCAEGYYAVGLGKRLPKATIYVIEPDERSLLIAQKNAENNGVRLIVAPPEEAFSGADFVIMDCEGAETEYLNEEKYPGLVGATVIVELHQKPGSQDVVNIVRKNMPTHDGKLICEGARNPNQSNFLWGKTSLERWLIVCESRPCIMIWAVLRPQAR